MAAPVPVTLITGFLGAGKSTLVSHVLSANHGRRVAVVVNEFGAGLGIDRALVQDAGGGASAALVEEFIELPNGCICCTVKDSFLQTLEALLTKRDKFDHVLVETTGLADPGPVAQALWADDAVEPGAALDAIVTLVDAAHIRAQLREAQGSEAARQVAYADVLLLNKSDLVSEEELAEVEAVLRGINAAAEVVRTLRSVVDLRHVFDVDTLARRGGGGERLQRLLPLAAAPPPPGRAFARGALALLAPPAHDARVATICVACDEPIDEPRLRDWLDTLLWEPAASSACADVASPPEVLRAKGVLRVSTAPPRLRILQVVRQLYDLTDAAAPELLSPGGGSRLLLIGRHLHAPALLASLAEVGPFYLEGDAARGDASVA